MKYVLLVYDDPKQWESVSDEQMADLYKEYAAVSEDPASVGGAQLQPVEAARTVRIKNGETLVTDGPFAETKETLGGYYVVETDSPDKALALAARIPSARLGGSIEVRPLVEM
jgi:hypothetical protein